MIKKVNLFNIYLLLALFFFVATSKAFAVKVIIGSTEINVPAYSGFSEISSISPEIFKMVQDICPPTNNLVGVFLTEADVNRIVLGEEPIFSPQILVQYMKEFESLTITKALFSELRGPLRKEHDSMSEDVQSLMEQMAGKVGKVFSERYDSEVLLKLGGVVFLGVDSENASSITFSQLIKTNVSVYGEVVDIITATTYTMQLIKGKVLFVYASKTYDSEDDLEWTRKISSEYAK
jgi:hypothetical protein